MGVAPHLVVDPAAVGAAHLVVGAAAHSVVDGTVRRRSCGRLGPVDRLLQTVVTAAEPPGPLVVLGSAAAVLVLVAVPALWRRVRGVVTLAHEGGHALAAVLTGRRLTGVRIHLDTSGLTLSRGRPRGPGMVLTLLAGYPAPPLLGLVGALLVSAGRAGLLLVILCAGLLALLVAIRNLVGLLAVVLTGAVLAVVVWWGGVEAWGVAGSLVAWLLVVGGLLAVLETGLSRRRRTARLRGVSASDADQLAALTGLPAVLWLGGFVVLALAALVLAGALLWGGPGAVAPR